MTPRHESSMFRLGWAPYLGKTSNLVYLRILGRYPIKLQAELKDAGKAFHQVLINTNYEDPTDFIGSYMFRTIGGLNVYSTHAYATAIDLDYGGDTDGDGDPIIDKNPYIRRPIVPGDPGFGVEWQILEHQVNAIEGILNTFGEPIWLWKGWSIGDTMHFQARVRPERTEVDWSTVNKGEELMPKEQWHQMIDALFLGQPDEFHGSPDYWKNEVPADSPEWNDFWAAFVRVIS